MTAKANENMKMGGDGHDNIVEYDEELPEKKENSFYPTGLYFIQY